MKRLPVVILLVVLALMAVVTGCGPRYDSRLVEADGLMRDNPDSALTLMEGLDSATLATKGDSAYRDLLLTQARYRCYVTATSDSAINRALAYYRAHPGEREKLTRAYIYKGAVMEELGHPDSAMLYYKHAETVAAPDDYFKLGQINTRIGSLYRYYYADAQTCYEKYKTAFDYYKKANDSILMLNSLYNMGMCSGIIGNRKALEELMAASSLALELNDSAVYYDSQEMLVRQFVNGDSSLKQAKLVALHLLHDYSNYLTCDFLIDLAAIYFKETKIDSAKLYLRMVDAVSESNETRVKIRLYDLLANIAEVEGDSIKSFSYADRYRLLLDSLNNNKVQYNIQFVENKVNEESAMFIKKAKKKQQYLVGTILVAVLLFLILLTFRQYLKNKTLKSILRELKSEKVNNHDTLLKELNARESSIVQLVENMVSFMRTSINASEKDPPKIIKRRIQESIHEVANENFWKELRTYLDTNHNNIISKIAENKRINETDIRFIELLCCGFSYIEIAITLGYSPNFVSNKRIRITKKLGLKTSLQDYLTAEMKG